MLEDEERVQYEDEDLAQSMICKMDMNASEAFLQNDQEERKEKPEEKLYNIQHVKDNEYKMNITVSSPEKEGAF